MNSPETQSDSFTQKTYFDPEVLDTSEEEFSASLEMADMQPGVVVNSFDPEPLPDSSSFTGVECRAPVLSEVEGSRPASADVQARPEQSLTNDSLAKPNQHDAPAASPLDEQTESDWRDQVSAKVKNYKTLKPRKERYPSLQLQFDSGHSWKLDAPPASIADRGSLAALRSSFSEQIPQSEPRVSVPATTEATARVLEFPRPGTLPFNRDELAEPVIDRPRIMEAPELLPPPPALGGILIEPSREPEPERQPGIDMPLQTARFSRRVFAAAIDGFVVAAALAIFGYMFLRFNSSLPQMRAAGEMAAALLGILWFAYQSAFLIFCGTTPGLRAARMNIARFDGTPAPRTLRRWRVLASVLSCASLGLGYAWCFFDEDQLCWHDRLTRTHLAPRK
jgi:uncharacterized RDD family membrane protein YckC